jgi:hypothetical protein
MLRNFNHVIRTQGKEEDERELIKESREKKANYGSIFKDTLPK